MSLRAVAVAATPRGGAQMVSKGMRVYTSSVVKLVKERRESVKWGLSRWRVVVGALVASSCRDPHRNFWGSSREKLIPTTLVDPDFRYLTLARLGSGEAKASRGHGLVFRSRPGGLRVSTS
jgi:hypothetical protein